MGIFNKVDDIFLTERAHWMNVVLVLLIFLGGEQVRYLLSRGVYQFAIVVQVLVALLQVVVLAVVLVVMIF